MSIFLLASPESGSKLQASMARTRCLCRSQGWLAQHIAETCFPGREISRPESALEQSTVEPGIVGSWDGDVAYGQGMKLEGCFGLRADTCS